MSQAQARKDLKRRFQEYLKEQGAHHGLWTRRFGSKVRNGSDSKTTLSGLLGQYRKIHLPLLTESARYRLDERLHRFTAAIEDFKLCELDSKIMAHFLGFLKLEHNPQKNPRKCSFLKELKDFKAMLNWHKNQNDFQFQNPVQSYHMKLAVMSPPPERNHQVSVEEFKKFLKELSPFYQRFVLAQLNMAARCGEIAGLQKKNVDFENGTVTIKEVMVWIKSEPKIKPVPKNGKARVVTMNDTLRRVLKEQMENSCKDSDLVFSYRNPEGVRYNSINKAYNTAWKQAGLAHKYSGTHIIRYLAARLSREMFGTLDHVRAITGHLSPTLAAHYSQGDLSKLNVEVAKGFDGLELSA